MRCVGGRKRCSDDCRVRWHGIERDKLAKKGVQRFIFGDGAPCPEGPGNGPAGCRLHEEKHGPSFSLAPSSIPLLSLTLASLSPVSFSVLHLTISFMCA